MKNVGNSSRGHSQGVPKIFRATMYRAHCAVIFAIAELACLCCSRAFVDTNSEPTIVCEISHLSERLRQKLKVCV